MNGNQTGVNLTIIAPWIGLALTRGMTIDQMNLFGNFLTTVASCIMTVAAADFTNTDNQENPLPR
ncbi:MAG: hypothetical protein RR396_05470 [Clostridiales bacterium]